MQVGGKGAFLFWQHVAVYMPMMWISSLEADVQITSFFPQAADTYANCIEAATPLPLQDFVVYLCERLRAVWRELDGADPRTHTQNLATYHPWITLPLKPRNGWDPSHLLPRYLELELRRHVLRNIARFCLRAHTLRVEIGCWQIHNRLCDKCDLHDVQDETCPCLEMCCMRRKFEEQFADCTGRTYIGDMCFLFWLKV